MSALANCGIFFRSFLEICGFDKTPSSLFSVEFVLHPFIFMLTFVGFIDFKIRFFRTTLGSNFTRPRNEPVDILII